MKISVLGCGRWGTFIAWYLDRIGHKVTIFGRESSKNFNELKQIRKNAYLSLSVSMELSSDLEFCVCSSEIIVISISCQNLREFMSSFSEFEIKSLKGKIIVLCMKGLEEKTGKRLSQIVEEFVPKETKIAVWVGPGHVQSLTNGIPNCMVIDSKDEKTKNKLVHEFTSNLIRFYYGTDLIGSEVGAAAKNVVGIAAGALDGLSLGPLKGALMTRGAWEISKLIKAMGGNEMSAYGLCHLGDYEATLFSENSNNLQFGKSLITGKKYDKLSEGIYTSKALILLGEKYKVDLPICNTVKNLVENNINVGRAMADLFLRDIKSEF